MNMKVTGYSPSYWKMGKLDYRFWSFKN